MNSFDEIYDVSRIFLYIEKGGSSTTFKVPYAYVKEFPFLLLNVYQSTQENARERERKFPGNHHYFSMVFQWNLLGLMK